MPIAWSRGTVESGGELIYWEGANLDADPTAAPTVVLGHGAGGNHAVWFQQVPVLADRYRVVTWDTRGFGNSTFVTGDFGIAHSTADLAAVLDETGTERAHLVGQSMGGWWITGAALTFPDRVLSLTYCDTPGGLFTPALRAAFDAFVAGPGLNAGEPQVGVHPALAVGMAERRPDLAFLYQQLGTYVDPPMRAVVESLVGEHVEPGRIAALDKPKLVLAGDQDALFPARGLRELADVLGAGWVEIADAGHSPYFERADEFNTALLDFLADR